MRENKQSTGNSKPGISGMLAIFVIMFVFWVLMSACIRPGHCDYIRIAIGMFCAAIVTLISHDLLLAGSENMNLVKTWRLLLYIPWELWQIVLANFDVAYRVLHPKMPIDPRIIEFDTSLRSDFALTTLANSITLTPGTITIDVEPERGRFLVHAIAQKPADALLVDKTMQNKVAHVYMEE